MHDSKKFKKPIENQKTAAWAEIMRMDAISNVTQPNIEQVINAKDYVEENEK